MISEQDKQKILNGAYGISRDGTKCKYIGRSQYPNYSHVFMYINEHGFIINTVHLNKEFKGSISYESLYDVIGLWEDKPEPFDLERALAGEPVMLRDGSKACILSKLPKRVDFNYFPSLPLIGLEEGSLKFLYWAENGRASMINDETSIDIVSMWKDPEPESNTVTLTLPCPLKEPTDELWFIYGGAVRKSNLSKNSIVPSDFEQSIYFGSETAAQAWLDAMRNSRR